MGIRDIYKYKYKKINKLCDLIFDFCSVDLKNVSTHLELTFLGVDHFAFLLPVIGEDYKKKRRVIFFSLGGLFSFFSFFLQIEIRGSFFNFLNRVLLLFKKKEK